MADQLNKQIQGNDSHPYTALGSVTINFKQPQNYRRELNIGSAISTISYEVDDIKYKREYFVSYPDQIKMRGYAPIRGVFDEKKGTRFTSIIQAKNNGITTLICNGRKKEITLSVGNNLIHL